MGQGWVPIQSFLYNLSFQYKGVSFLPYLGYILLLVINHFIKRPSWLQKDLCTKHSKCALFSCFYSGHQLFKGFCRYFTELKCSSSDWGHPLRLTHKQLGKILRVMGATWVNITGSKVWLGVTKKIWHLWGWRIKPISVDHLLCVTNEQLGQLILAGDWFGTFGPN